MWTFNTDYNKWVSVEDTLSKESFDFLKQELASTRFYSKCLSGATYLPINNLDNIYDILGEYEPKNWFVSTAGSLYSNSITPYQYPTAITNLTSYDYYTKYLSEYGLTLKNKFTPDRLIKDSVKNYIYVDVTTTEEITLGSVIPNLKIDGILLLEGHRVLVKNQKSIEVLPYDTDPNSYFKGNYTETNNYGATIEYTYFNSENGIYEYKNNLLVRTNDLTEYEDCIRFSVLSKLGDVNSEKQFHLSRLLDGYFPVFGDPMEFIEKHNWLLRNQVDYNNLFEINYYDILKHGTQSYTEKCEPYYINGITYSTITYSIPERIISIGEFGIILNTQFGVSNIIQNKYKLNLRSISQTTKHYWIVGDDSLILKVRKHDFYTEKIEGNITTNITSISFFNDLRGVIVGDLNTILITSDGGYNWNKIIIDDFRSYYYNKALYYNINSIYIGGNTGVFLELKEDISGWSTLKRRISRYVDSYEEYLLVDNINDIYSYSTTTWGLSFSSFGTQSNTLSTETNKELLFIVTDDSKIIAYDINDCIPSFTLSGKDINFDFIYLDFKDNNYGDITNITGLANNKFYFTGITELVNDTPLYGILSFDLNNFQYIGVDNSYSNTISITQSAIIENNNYINKFYNYKDSELLICGNTSLLESSTFSSTLTFSSLDVNFSSRLKSKMLFVDYDIASKLNFFTDAGEYRLPISATVSTTNLNTPLTSKISFNTLYDGTQSETNWWTYYTDTQKTFEYYAGGTYSNAGDPLDESSKVLMSSTFSRFSTSPTFVINILTAVDVTNDILEVRKLAPTVGTDLSRYENSGSTLYEPIYNKKLFIYDDIMVIKFQYGMVKQGDVILFDSSVVTTKLVVNKVVKLSQYNNNHYAYIYTDFNQNIINELCKITDTITITNLNNYSSMTQLKDNFNLHPIGTGYEMLYNGTYSNTLTIKPKFNNVTSYYNLATNININNVIVATMSYTDGFLKFGYTPTYNILDYLEGLNSTLFYNDKEYFSMPLYSGIPMGVLTPTTTYIDTSGIQYGTSSVSTTTGNKVLFGVDLKLEWESIFINTFIDITVYATSSYYDAIEDVDKYTTERLLILKKYYDSVNDAYVIEFHKNMNFPIDTAYLTGLHFIDINSRRKLSQISSDLQELNNIQRARLKQKKIKPGYSFYNYERDLNFKIPTDSYSKILLSDVDTIEQLSAVVYIDDKNELSMNMTRLEKEYNIPIINTLNFNGNLLISCLHKHDLKDDDGIVLEFTGTQSSLQLNQQYLGYHSVKVVNDYNFYIEIPFGINIIGNDTGYVKYTRKDPFLNYTPVDIIDIGIDKKGKKAVELKPENLKLTGDVYSLVNVDFSKYRFRLVDGLTVETLSLSYPWILDAEITDAIIGIDTDLIWYKGVWECGRWFSGSWISGTWKSGDWYGGTWDSKKIKDNLISIEIDSSLSTTSQSVWMNGRWYDGTWNNGTWVNGRWYGGTWNNGSWYKGIWNDGTWNNGQFSGGIWVIGTWNNGILNCNNDPSYWLEGKWNGGDFENGIWYSGIFEEKNAFARFGTMAYNSRTAIWKSGQWLSGSFYSRINVDENGVTNVSYSHKYAIWYTGSWYNGSWYGGIAYNMDFKSGTWYGGILDEIEVINTGLTYSNSATQSSIVLNGVFNFNINDEINIINTDGSNLNTKIIDISYDTTLPNYTFLTINLNNSYTLTTGYSDTGLRLVSRFRNANWKSGIWTNGLYDSGLWEGGIWYNGIFSANWIS